VIIVDTSIWVDHFRAGSATVARLLDGGLVLAHPWVVGELALGHLRDRDEIIGLLHRLAQPSVATPAEVLTLIEAHGLYGIGIGYVDAQLLASTRLTAGATLWTSDTRLAAAASRMGSGFHPDPSAEPAG
jgi:predicted nucleic acid-binding protein